MFQNKDANFIFLILASIALLGLFLTGGINTFPKDEFLPFTPGHPIPETPSPESAFHTIQEKTVPIASDTPTPTPLPTNAALSPQPNNPLPSSSPTNPIANFAAWLVNTLKNSPRCFKTASGYAYLVQGDIVCVPELPNRAKEDELVYSVNNFPNLECLNFTRAIAQATNHRFTKVYPWASLVFNDPPPGYIAIPKNTPAQPGDIVVFGGGYLGFGHIAHVVTVYGSRAVKVAEGNGDGKGSVDFFTYGINSSYNNGLHILGWLRLK